MAAEFDMQLPSQDPDRVNMAPMPVTTDYYEERLAFSLDENSNFPDPDSPPSSSDLKNPTRRRERRGAYQGLSTEKATNEDTKKMLNDTKSLLQPVHGSRKAQPPNKSNLPAFGRSKTIATGGMQQRNNESSSTDSSGSLPGLRRSGTTDSTNTTQRRKRRGAYQGISTLNSTDGDTKKMFSDTKSLLQPVPETHRRKDPDTICRTEKLFQDIRSLLQPVRRVEKPRRASVPLRVHSNPEFKTARRLTLPSKLPSEIGSDFHTPYARQMSTSFDQGEIPVTLKRIPNISSPPKRQEGEMLVLLQHVPLPPGGHQWQGEVVILKPIPWNRPQPASEKGELCILKGGHKRYDPPNKEEGEFHLRPIPKKYQPPNEEEGEMVALIPRKSVPIPKGSSSPQEEEEEEDFVAPPPVEPAPSPPPKEEKPLAMPKPVTPTVAKPVSPQPEPATAAENDDGRVVKEDGTIRVWTSDVYMAYSIPNCSSEPSDKDYTKLAKATQQFFGRHLKKKYPTFQKVQVNKHRAFFGRDIPNAEYCVYVEWGVLAEFGGPSGTPDRHQLCQNLVKKTNLNKYLSKDLKSLFKSPWKKADGVFIEQVSLELE